MKSIASCIIALEPEPERARRLKELVREKVDAELIVAHSWDEAAAAMSSHPPDVILVSSLLSPAEEAKLLQHLRELDIGWDPAVLFVPPVVEQQRRAVPSGLPFSLAAWRSRARSRWPLYDVDAIGSRITDALGQSRSARGRRIRLVNGTGTSDRQASPPAATQDTARPAHTRRLHSHRAQRWTPAELPWVCSIHTRWGIDASIVNISRSGILIESPSRLATESTIELHVRGPETTLDVPARVVRSEVSIIDVRGVKYRAAAIFDAGLHLLSDEPGLVPRTFKTSPVPASTSQAVIYGSTPRSLNAW